MLGGDFNVRNAPDRYYHKAESRPFTVVSEFCSRPDAGCRTDRPIDRPDPWLASQDLQAFADGGPVTIRPREVRTIFDDRNDSPRLSDHDGYLVRYQIGER